MGDVLGFNVPIDMPSFTGGAGGSSITLVLLLIVIFALSAIGVWFFLNWRTYNKKIILFENIAGAGFQPTFKDRARILKVGDGGEELLYLRKKKVHRTAYGKKMGKNTYWFCVGQDGYWYNVVLGDIDAKMGMLDIEPIDRDMRYMHVAIRKNITERYRKLGVMDKYGTWIMGTVFFLIMIGSLWFLIREIGGLINQATAAVEAAKTIMEPMKEIISKIDTICAGGSGISQA